MKNIRVWIKNNQLVCFLIIAFGYSWVFKISLAILAPERSQDPALYIPSIYGPTIAALLMPLLSGGFPELKAFLKKRLLGPVKIFWYLVAVFGIPGLLLVLRGLHLVIFPEISLDGLSIGPVSGILTGFVMSLPFGPLGEELGWRGYALPLLQKKMSQVFAALVLGVIWWAWHLPQLLIPELQWAVGGMPALLYLVIMLPGSVLAVWIFNHSGKSVVPLILFHASMNYFLGLLGFNSPYFIFMLIGGLWAAAILIILGSGLSIRYQSAASQKSVQETEDI